MFKTTIIPALYSQRIAGTSTNNTCTCIGQVAAIVQRHKHTTRTCVVQAYGTVTTLFATERI